MSDDLGAIDGVTAWKRFGRYRITAEGYLWCGDCGDYGDNDTWSDQLLTLLALADKHNAEQHPDRMPRRS